VPFAPGGRQRFHRTFVAQRLTEALGKQVIVENKPGLAACSASSRASGGARRLYAHAIAASLHGEPELYKLNFDPVNDITPIIQMAQGPLLIVVPPSLPVRTPRS